MNQARGAGEASSPMLHGRPVAILGGVRIPFCRQNTAYADVGNLGMSVRTLGALVEKYGLQGAQLGEVAMGAVIKHSSDWNLGREAALSSGLSPLTPGITLLRAFAGFSPRELKPDCPGVAEPRTGKSMGQHCEDMAKELGIPREAQDELAIASHHKLAAAYERGFFDD